MFVGDPDAAEGGEGRMTQRVYQLGKKDKLEKWEQILDFAKRDAASKDPVDALEWKKELEAEAEPAEGEENKKKRLEKR